MSFLDNIFNKNQKEIRSAETGSLLEYLEGNTQVSVNEDNVLQVSAIKNAVDLIAGTISTFEVNLYDKNGKKIEDNRTFLLNNEPNDFESASKYKKDIVKDMLLNGKSYTFIDKKGLSIEGLYYIKSSQVTRTDVIGKNGLIMDKRYNFTLNNVSLEKNSFNMLEVDYGKGILKENSNLLQTLIYINDFDNYLFKNAILPSGMLETDGRLTQETAKNLREQLERLYSGAKQFFRPMILEQGLKWKPINQKPNDLMLDKAKIEAVKEVERIFNLPYGIFNNTTNQSVVDQNTIFLNRTLSPILVALEDGLNKSLLLESEKKKGYYFRFDVSELLRLAPDKMLEYVVGLEKNCYVDHKTACILLDQEPYEKEQPQQTETSVPKDTVVDSESNVEEVQENKEDVKEIE